MCIRDRCAPAAAGAVWHVSDGAAAFDSGAAAPCATQRVGGRASTRARAAIGSTGSRKEHGPVCTWADYDYD
eukprot:2764719-Prymnesium_polylepis.1